MEQEEKIDIEESKKKFIELYKQNVKREGSDKFLEWLKTTDFFTAPASCKLHSSYVGGLCIHSLNVYEEFIKEVKSYYGDDFDKKCSFESLTIMALFHDLCKVNTFIIETKNVKEYSVDGQKQDSKGRFNWVEKEMFAVEDSLPYGHGEKSVYMLSGFFKLTREEAIAINWHMGGFDTRVKGGSYSLSDAYYQYPVALLLHIADMKATYLDEQKS